jgi:uncharacterized membrane protein
MKVTDGVTIDASVERVWDVFSDVERWPAWTASITSLTLIEGSDVAVGTRVRIKQPRFPHLVWEVTEVEPGVSWTWVSTSPGARTAATHILSSRGPASTDVVQIIEQTGPLGVLVGRLTRRLTRRYLTMEAAGLKQRVEADVTTA